MERNLQAVILAAGKSTRFRTKKTKMLHTICGQEMILYPIKVMEKLQIETIVVVGHQKDAVMAAINRKSGYKINFVEQHEQLGTGHALLQTTDLWSKDNILILNADIPLVEAETIKALYEEHVNKKAVITFASTRVFNPAGYGRIVKNNGTYKIVEEKDCNDAEREINIVNSGIYIMQAEFLRNNLKKIPKNKKIK